MFLKPTTTPLRVEPSCFRLKFQERARLRQLPVTSSAAGVGVAIGVGVATGLGVGDGGGGQSAAVERSPQAPPLPHAPTTSAKATAVASANTLRIALIICILLPSRAGRPRLGWPRVLQARCREWPHAPPSAQPRSGTRLCVTRTAPEAETRAFGTPTHCAAPAQ